MSTANIRREGIRQRQRSKDITAKDIISQNVIRAQIGGQALLAGTEISLEAVEALRQQGIDPGAARQAFNQVQNIQQAGTGLGYQQIGNDNTIT